MYDRDALIAAVDLAALADELLGEHRGSARSAMWRCPNPQHAQTGRTPPVSIFTSHRGEQRWRCHGCGAGGTAIDLVMACCGTDPRRAMEFLARRAGLREQGPAWTGRRMTRHPAPPPRGVRDQAGLDAYVDDCAAALWTPPGRAVKRWLNDARRLPDDVLRANKIGADLGPHRQHRPEGMPKASGAVLPVVRDGHAVYTQLRVIRPQGDGPRYLNPRADLAPNPRLGFFEPAERLHREVIVTEGTIDALSAATAGYRAAAVLSAAYPDQAIALELSRLREPLVLAFDQDDAGRAAGSRLAALLDVQGRRPTMLTLPVGDLNDALAVSDDWRSELLERLELVRGDRSSLGRQFA